MKNFFVLGMALALVSATTAMADKPAQKGAMKSGLQPGENVGPFYVTKCAGAEEDGVAEGKNLCYRCRNGSKPQVMVFTRSNDPKVTELVSKLDAAIGANADSKLTVFVNVLNEDKDDASEMAKKFASTTKAKSIPFVVPNENANGPDNYGINPKADVTIVMANEGNVKANYSVANAKKLDIDAVIGNLGKILE
ncbi:hypothetical protein Pla52o_46000 [Novipirellula galeiformis]|uniref:Secreted protein n=1 Tax=Novipirellula galeiformis TaxID=2528004 RepID=A0A5C6C9N7_9BACT|nr:hypothetical protein [Novipirellula galeiformis]TWU20086.1 hypothetical protein Pla52o_46000 [Novipirellula galeiformis]